MLRPENVTSFYVYFNVKTSIITEVYRIKMVLYMSIFLAYNYIKQVINKNYMSNGTYFYSRRACCCNLFNRITTGAIYRFVVAHSGSGASVSSVKQKRVYCIKPLFGANVFIGAHEDCVWPKYLQLC